ncbi:mediator of RNA polymerase II transcription subunit 7 [[Candida] jaroonii]|uniref:Mediator of RNA polymerase II transcription subunit 7 n=1 Tax=[Candida] jaroonii TaxID=467808 RepID=A0ACA9YC28_9ASCO|nr:mediator of RNA polymerase II transcription subunit 7 [[Candida] jaroonii]
MAEDLISSLYPPPPIFYRYFTEENREKYEQLDNTEDLQGELKFFKPPTPPTGEYYKGYGNIWSFEDKLPGLEAMGFKQLYKDEVNDLNNSNLKIEELHKLVKSLLSNYVELLGIMSINPKEFSDKVEDLKTIIININHILNSYRPHQSRESLIMLLKNQITNKNNEITTIDNTIKDVKTNIEKLIDYNLVKVSNDDEKTNDNDIIDNILNKLHS